MRNLTRILKDYLLFLNEDKNLGYTEAEITAKLESDTECNSLLELLLKDLSSTEMFKGQEVSTERSFEIFCKVVISKDIKTGRSVWNTFVAKQFLLWEHNEQVCYLAGRGLGKTFFLRLYIIFKMFLLPYFDACYSTNTPKQKRRFMKDTEDMIDNNELLLEKKNKKRASNREISWSREEMEYNHGLLEGTTIGTTPRGGHYNLVCLVPDEKVLTYHDGLVSIKDIKINDLVFTHKGQWKPVTDLMRRIVKEDIYCIQPYYYPDKIKLTGNHPIYSVKGKKCYQKTKSLCMAVCKEKERFRWGRFVNNCSKRYYRDYKKEWVRAENVTSTDFLCIPINRKVISRTEFHDRIVHKNVLTAQDKVPKMLNYGKNRNLCGDKKRQKRIVEQKYSFVWNRHLWRFIGYWLAEGSLSHLYYGDGKKSKTKSRINLAFNSNETEIIADVKYIVTTIFGRKLHCYTNKNSTTLCFNHRFLSRFILDSFGEHSSKKKIPLWFEEFPLLFQKELIKGYFLGDGCYTNNHYRITSVNKKLLLSVQRILLRFNMISSVRYLRKKVNKTKICGKDTVSNICFDLAINDESIEHIFKFGFKKNKKKQGNRSWIDKNYWYVPIKTIKKEKYEGSVYNIEVKDDHSYSLSLMVVHNCIDDILREDQKYTYEYTVNYIEGVLKPTTYTKKARYGVVGTPWDSDDPFHTLMNEKLDKHSRPIGKIIIGGYSQAGYYCEIFPAFNEKTKEILIPEIWTYERLMEEKIKIGEIRFNREMLCLCSSYKNSLIGSALFRSCCDPTMRILQKGEPGKNYIIFVDSATSDSPTADFCSMVVFEDNKESGKFILRHLKHYKGQPITDPSGGTDDQTHDLYKLYKDFNKSVVIIEKNNAGVALVQSFKAITAKFEGSSVDVIEHYTHTVSQGVSGKSNDVINYIEFGLKSNVVVFPSDPEDSFTLDVLYKVKDEHLNFGVKKGKTGEKYEALAGHDDIFDSCCCCFKYRGDNIDTIPYAITFSGGM